MTVGVALVWTSFIWDDVLGLRFVGLSPGSLRILLSCLAHPVSSIVFGGVVESGPFTDGEIGNWPYSVRILVKFTSFLSALRWRDGDDEMGKHLFLSWTTFFRLTVG